VDADIRALAERTVTDLSGYETAEAYQLARAVLALLAERDGLDHAMADMRREILDRFGEDGDDWMTALVRASAAIAERDELQSRENDKLTDSEAFRAGVVAAITDRDALLETARGWGSLEEYVAKRLAEVTAERDELARWKAATNEAVALLSRAAGCDDLRPHMHGDAILHYLGKTAGRFERAFKDAHEAHAWRAATEAALDAAIDPINVCAPRDRQRALDGSASCRSSPSDWVDGWDAAIAAVHADILRRLGKSTP